MAKARFFSPPTFLSQLMALFLFSSTVSADFYTDVNVLFGDQRAKILDNGRELQLTLDKASGSGIESKQEFLLGKFDMQIKLVPGNSAGTVTTFYLSSQGSTQDEIDFEFLGNLSGDPYILHTNVYTKGKGQREQEFYLWFDPRADFHTYSILWNPQRILFYVDGIPIRVFQKFESFGVPYLKDQPMRLYSTLWNGDNWATRQGLEKIDWSWAPFTASYRNISVDACVSSARKTACTTSGGSSSSSWLATALDSHGKKKLRWVQRNYMIYNYCADTKRFPHGLPPECSL